MNGTRELGLPRIVLGSARKRHLANIRELIRAHFHRASKDEQLAAMARLDPSLMLEMYYDHPYLEEALNQDLSLTASVVLDAGIRVNQNELFGHIPLLSLRTGEKKMPSLKMLTMALEHGYDANSRLVLPSSYSESKSESLLQRYTCSLNLQTGNVQETIIRDLIRSVRVLIQHGANEFDPITGPGKEGAGFLAILCTGRYLNDDTFKSYPSLIDETVELMHFAVSHGASIDYNNSSGNGTLLTTTIKFQRTMMATELIGLGCSQQCTQTHAPFAPMPLVDLARAELGGVGCSKIIEAVMRRRIKIEAAVLDTKLASSNSRRRTGAL